MPAGTGGVVRKWKEEEMQKHHQQQSLTNVA